MEEHELTCKVTPHFKHLELLSKHAPLLHLHGNDAEPNECCLHKGAGLQLPPGDSQHTVHRVLGVLLRDYVEEKFLLRAEKRLCIQILRTPLMMPLIKLVARQREWQVPDCIIRK